MLNQFPDKDLYVVLDSDSSHRSKRTVNWAKRQKRVYLRFTLTNADWLNQIEIWFGILTRKVVRRGIFTSREELVTKLMEFIASYDKDARPFQWTYTGDPLAA